MKRALKTETAEQLFSTWAVSMPEHWGMEGRGEGFYHQKLLGEEIKASGSENEDQP